MNQLLQLTILTNIYMCKITEKYTPLFKAIKAVFEADNALSLYDCTIGPLGDLKDSIEELFYAIEDGFLDELGVPKDNYEDLKKEYGLDDKELKESDEFINKLTNRDWVFEYFYDYYTDRIFLEEMFDKIKKEAIL